MDRLGAFSAGYQPRKRGAASGRESIARALKDFLCLLALRVLGDRRIVASSFGAKRKAKRP
jgi:hypothetical protein